MRYPGYSGENLVLAGDLVLALANQLGVAAPAGAALGSVASGGNIKTNELVDKPDAQIMVTSDANPKLPQLKLSRIHLMIYVRDVDRGAALTNVGKVVDFLHQKARRLDVPGKGSIVFYFVWDQFESFYRDQVRRLIFPLAFTGLGQPTIV